MNNKIRAVGMFSSFQLFSALFWLFGLPLIRLGLAPNGVDTELFARSDGVAQNHVRLRRSRHVPKVRVNLLLDVQPVVRLSRLLCHPVSSALPQPTCLVSRSPDTFPAASA